MPFKHGKFGPAGGTKPGAIHSTGSKAPEPQQKHSQDKGEAQAAHNGPAMEHVTKTHPGATTPHPVTGVHAHMSMHKGGGKYTSHTHHDGGEVESREHNSHQEMQQAHDEALPDENQGQPEQDDGSGMDQMGELPGIGGESSGGAAY
jgi:hypothetical protein